MPKTRAEPARAFKPTLARASGGYAARRIFRSAVITQRSPSVKKAGIESAAGRDEKMEAYSEIL